MKALSCTFAALAILLSDVMCAPSHSTTATCSGASAMLLTAHRRAPRFCSSSPTPPPSRSAPRSRSSFGEKAQNAEKEPPYGEPYGGFSFTFSQTGCRACSGRSGTRRCSPPASLRRSQTIRTVPLPPSPRPRRSRPPPRG